MDAHQLVADWEARGSRRILGGHDIFVVDVAATSSETGPPLLVLHGFPTCSFDWHAVVPMLSEHRRVILFDLLGFGLSAKPDVAYRIATQADLAQELVRSLGLAEVSLITHDLGDTVGGELLARSLDGTLGFDIVERVLTNGSIYIELAQLTAGQQLLLSLPDERLDPSLFPGADGFTAGLRATFAPTSPVDDDELGALWLMTSRDDGQLLMTRTIRYIEERRANQARFTGPIETHPAPLTIVWGDLDPVAVHPMALRLAAARPDASLVTLDGVGHYPMVEAPARFATAVTAALSTSPPPT